MNAYDRLPVGLKIAHLLLCFAPSVAAGILNHSWKSAAIVFFGGSLLALVALQICSAIVRKTYMGADGEVDAARARPILLLTFLLVGPLAGAIVAVFVLR